METKNFTSKITGKTYTLKKLTFGEVSKILDKSNELDPKTFIPTPSIWKRRLQTIKAAVVQPQLSEAKIEKMTPTEGIELFTAIQEYNSAPLSESPSQSSQSKEASRRQARSRE